MDIVHKRRVHFIRNDVFIQINLQIQVDNDRIFSDVTQYPFRFLILFLFFFLFNEYSLFLYERYGKADNQGTILIFISFTFPFLSPSSSKAFNITQTPNTVTLRAQEPAYLNGFKFRKQSTVCASASKCLALDTGASKPIFSESRT